MIDRKGFIIEPPREIPVISEVDVLVAGGGVAGIAAAVAAGRAGARTVLVERGGALGGAATVALMHVFYTPYQMTSGIMRELCDRLLRLDAARPGELVSFNPEALKYVVLQMLDEAGVRVLLHTSVSRALLEGASINGVVVENKSGRQGLRATAVVDATGDGDVAALAGAEFEIGREEDQKTLPMSLLFRVGGINMQQLIEYVRRNPDQFTRDPNTTSVDPSFASYRIFGFFDLVDAARKRGELDPDCHWLRLEGVDEERGLALVNSTNVYATGLDAEVLMRAELSGRKQVHQLATFLKNYVPGFSMSYVIDIGATIGIRETRRILGDYVLTHEDILEGRPFEDIVAVDWQRQSRAMHAGVGYTHAVAGHSPDGQAPPRDTEAHLAEPAPLLGIRVPYRSLLPRGVEQLLVAGRCISTTHDAQGYTRNQGCCVATGQAAGTAAALATQRGVTSRSLDVRLLQRMLVEQGVDLEGEASNGVNNGQCGSLRCGP